MSKTTTATRSARRKSPAKPRPQRKTAFAELGLDQTIQGLGEEVRELYASDAIPWVLGYSGGKDSTATLQLIWSALKELAPEQRIKPVHVISTDTLVENPVVSAWVRKSLERMEKAAQDQGLPIQVHQLTPELQDSFWVNLIGKGYPAPRPKFRWCTERLKIKPSNAFIMNVVKESGEAILILGTRRAESSARSARMSALDRVRGRLVPNQSLPNSLVFSPIEDWTNDDVWLYLMQHPNPWGYNNKELLTMYQGASEDGECPLVVDTTTPSCGSSRFGCWVCTLVDEDKSMSAMIQNDEEKEWMLPLLELRNKFNVANDRPLRDFRRMTGHIQLFRDRLIHGPYTQESREMWLKEVLEAQIWVQENGPSDVADLELVSLAELHEIRRIWVMEKHEIEDRLPQIYKSVTDSEFPGGPLDDATVFGSHEIDLLKEVVDGDPLHFELLRELLHVELRFRTMSRRAGLFDAIDEAFERNSYGNEKEATERAQRESQARASAQTGEYAPVAFEGSDADPQMVGS